MARNTLLLALVLQTGLAYGKGAGSEGAAFLNIPAGGRPAAVGAAYTALATDAYAPLFNPAGLGFLETAEFAGTHLDYLESMSYQHAGLAFPFRQGSALGLSLQSLGTGDIPETDINGSRTGDFSSRYSAYSLAYGQAMSESLSLGLTGKVVQAKISDVSASAYAVDVGAMYQARPDLTLAAAAANLGSTLKFLSQGDDLPMALRLGGAYRPGEAWTLALEGVYRKTSLASAHMGAEYRPNPFISLRTGFRSDGLKELSALAGLSVGMGLRLGRYELAYAWMPAGALGNSQQFSFSARFGSAKAREEKAFLHRVRFSYADARARSVKLVGDFNGWKAEPMKREQDGIWVADKSLLEGKYCYNLVVDGDPVLDPSNGQTEKRWPSRCSVLHLSHMGAKVSRSPAGGGSR